MAMLACRYYVCLQGKKASSLQIQYGPRPRNFLAGQTAESQNNALENFGPLSNVEVVHDTQQVYHKTTLTSKTWRRTDESKELKVLLTAVSGRECDMLELHFTLKKYKKSAWFAMW